MSEILKSAVSEYVRREQAAMKTMKGADHRAIIEAVASEFSLQEDVLTEAVLDSTFGKVN